MFFLCTNIFLSFLVLFPVFFTYSATSRSCPDVLYMLRQSVKVFDFAPVHAALQGLAVARTSCDSNDFGCCLETMSVSDRFELVSIAVEAGNIVGASQFLDALITSPSSASSASSIKLRICELGTLMDFLFLLPSIKSISTYSYCRLALGSSSISVLNDGLSFKLFASHPVLHLAVSELSFLARKHRTHNLMCYLDLLQLTGVCVAYCD